MSRYIDHYDGQVGGGVNRVFVGSPYQRGHGLGSFLSGLFRRALPLLSRGARVVGKEALHTGWNILDDVAHNTPFKESLRARVTESGRNLKRKAEESLENFMGGSGYKLKKHGPPYHSTFSHTGTHIGLPALGPPKPSYPRKHKKPTQKKKKKKKKASSRKKSVKILRKPTKKKVASKNKKKKTRTVNRKRRIAADIFG